MKKFGFGIIAIALLVAGCATTPPSFPEVTSSWQGYNAQALIGAWGYPKEINNLPDGTQAYTYEIVPSLPAPVQKAAPTLPPEVVAAQAQPAKTVSPRIAAAEKAAAILEAKKPKPLPTNDTGIIV